MPLGPEEYNKRYIGWFHLIAAYNEHKLIDAAMNAFDAALKILKNTPNIIDKKEDFVELHHKIYNLAVAKMVKSTLEDQRAQIIMDLIEKKLAESSYPIDNDEVDKFRHRLITTPDPLVKLADNHMDTLLSEIKSQIHIINPNIGTNVMNTIMARVDDDLDRALGVANKIS